MAAEKEARLFNFETPAEVPTWRAENDGVMGGFSSGKGKIEGGSLIFSGELSLQKNGGFASLQTDDGLWNGGDAEGFTLRVKGDGRTYQFRVATEATHRGSRIDYKANFETVDEEWTEVTVRFADMIPSWRGQELDGPALDTSNLRQLRILLGDKKAGPFELRVDWIQFTE